MAGTQSDTTVVTLRKNALAWLAHPVSILALVLMAVNDHVLKAAYGTWWTGKLSDVAGLVVFPAVVAAVVSLVVPRVVCERLGFARLVAVSVGLTGLGFSWINVSAVGAKLAASVMSVVTGPGSLVVDLTDLLALPALGIAVWAAHSAAMHPRRRHADADAVAQGASRAARSRRWAIGAGVLPVALLASLASAQPDMDSNRIVDDLNGGWLLQIEECPGSHSTCYPSTQYVRDGDVWRYVAGGYEAPPVVEGLPTPTEACVPGDSQWCFRSVPGKPAIEETKDGLAWHVLWSLTEEDVTYLEKQLKSHRAPIASSGIAVLRTHAGVEVFAANGPDGVVHRTADGQWVREPAGYSESPPPLSIAVPSELAGTHAFGWGAAFAWALLAVGFIPIVASEIIPVPKPRRWWRYAVAAPIAVAFGFLATKPLEYLSVQPDALRQINDVDGTFAYAAGIVGALILFSVPAITGRMRESTVLHLLAMLPLAAAGAWTGALFAVSFDWPEVIGTLVGLLATVGPYLAVVRDVKLRRGATTSE